MTAQMVKNAVIVPVGAKGGFVVKRPPCDRAALADEVVACYRTFVRGLLDLTDNLRRQGRAPPDVKRHDGDDPYLVVAADKGRPRSPTSPTRSVRSTGSGSVTPSPRAARPATTTSGWASPPEAFESVKRHFRQLGINAETTEITAAGIGDMSGDVFGNGMLLFPHLKLVGVRPPPHPSRPRPRPGGCRPRAGTALPVAGLELGRLRRGDPLPGGRCLPRSAKVIPLSPEARELLGTEDEATPTSDPGPAPGAGRPAVERGDRHIREGEYREQCRRRGQGQRRR